MVSAFLCKLLHSLCWEAIGIGSGRSFMVGLGVCAPRKGGDFTLACSSGSFSKPRIQERSRPRHCHLPVAAGNILSNPPASSGRRRKNAHCHLCDKRFESRYKLKMHVNTHTGARPFTCDVCGKGFMRRTTLNAHRTIHDASQFSCPTCNRPFKRSSERLIHILLKVCLRKQRILRRTTSGWFCDVCNEGVPQPEEHRCPVKGRRRQCPVCGMDFGGQRDHKMLTHVRQDHPEFLASL
ncbi:putative fez family zinc finger protein 2-like [Penaeus vannamei]|uniref:Putative fez family zinc finger protein 2-like n=1 Tax=Penaeus vannamei TaxID=6689 RepID=A0A3R7Q3Y4_PENVA|nr:putative fez family zinc finger protein 2-like [Penaeus vannamei]